MFSYYSTKYTVNTLNLLNKITGRKLVEVHTVAPHDVLIISYV